MKAIDVSIVIPVYNKSNYLKKCLDSIVIQTKQEIEVICVDDCSTDQSAYIVEDFMKRDKRIKLIRNNINLGAGESRNIGLDSAIGKYIIFLDADDYFDVDLIRYMYGECCEKQLDLLHCPAFFTGHDLENKYLVQSSSSSFSSCMNRVISGNDLSDSAMYMIVCPYSNLIRRKFILENGIRFQNITNNNDAYFAKMCYLLAERLEISDKAFVCCRKNVEGQLSAKNKLYPHNFSLARQEIFKKAFKKGIYKKIVRGLNTYWATGMINYFYNLEYLDQQATMEVLKGDIKEFLEANDEKFMFNNVYQPQYLMDFLNCTAPDEIENPYEYCMRFEVDKKNELRSYLDNNTYQVVIWGYSNYGKGLYQALNNCGVSVKMIVDINYYKFDSDSVKSPDEIKGNRCFVISANAHTFDGISNEVKKLSEESVTFDFMSYFTYGLKFENCLRC